MVRVLWIVADKSKQGWEGLMASRVLGDGEGTTSGLACC